MCHCLVLAYEEDDAVMDNRFSWCGSIRKREKGSELLMSTQSLQNKGIIGDRGLGRNEWLLGYKIIGSVRWQCLQKSNKLLCSLACSVENPMQTWRPMSAWGL